MNAAVLLKNILYVKRGMKM